MSRRAKQRRRIARATDPERMTQAPEDTPFLILSNWEAANHSERRGFLMWHASADPRRELNPISDLEIRRRCHWLYQNTGIARRIVRGQAQLTGFLTPQPVTDNDDWNQAAFDYFQATAGSPYVYDARGRHDFFGAQVQVNIERAKDGRVLGVLTESPGGIARQAFYGAHQIRSGDKDTGWEQGVRLDRFDRHVAYRLADFKDPDRFASVSARDAIYYGNFDSMGLIHGLPLLAHAVTHLMDVTEIDSSTKFAIKKGSELGVVVERDAGPAIAMPNGQLIGVPTVREVEYTETTTDEHGTPTTVTKKRPVTWEQVMGPNGIQDLPPGHKVRIIADDRPGPNREAFTQRLVEHVIMGSDMPPAAVYYLSDLKGPGVRFTMEQIRRYVALRHRSMANECQRFWAYSIAKAVKTGRLPAPPENWWNQVLWIGLPDQTIDAGRDGAASITRLASGLTTWGDEWARQGRFGKAKINERIWEFAAAKAEAARAGDHYGIDLSLSEIIRTAGPEQSPDAGGDN